MLKVTENKLFIMSSVLCIAAICLWLLTGKAAGQSPEVIIAPQSTDAPLRIESAVIRSAQQSPHSDAIVSVEVAVNVRVYSYNPVSAYAVGYNYEGLNSPLRGVHQTNILSLDHALKPGQVETIMLNLTQSSPVKNIVLAVDFVELLDRTTWGADYFKTADSLAGQRAGARATVERLKEIEVAEGIAAVTRSTSDGLQIQIPRGKSRQWEEGFETGVAFIRNRLKKAYEKGGELKVKNELRQPYDASEGRQKQ